MAITTLLAVVPMADFDAGLAWYGRLLGRPADERPMDGLAQWQVAGDGGWLQLFRDADRAGATRVTLAVDDLDAHVREFADRGFTLEPADTASGMFRIATLEDPSGNEITFAQDLR